MGCDYGGKYVFVAKKKLSLYKGFIMLLVLVVISVSIHRMYYRWSAPSTSMFSRRLESILGRLHGHYIVPR